MIKDTELQKIYEKIYSTDIFNEFVNINMVDWDEFFWEASDYGIFKTLLESVDKIKENSPTAHGKEDSYKIITKDDKEFIINFNYISNQNSKIFAFEGQRYAKNDKPAEEFYKNLSNVVKSGELCFVEFHDKLNRHTLTGEVKVSAHELFSGLREAAMDSITNNLENLKGIVIRIFNKELERRLHFYTRILKNAFKDIFPNMLVDDKTEKDRGITLLVVTI